MDCLLFHILIKTLIGKVTWLVGVVNVPIYIRMHFYTVNFPNFIFIVNLFDFSFVAILACNNDSSMDNVKVKKNFAGICLFRDP